MPAKKVRELFNKHGVKYRLISHPLAYTAVETANAATVSKKNLAKAVMIKVDEQLVMAVAPASDKLDIKALKELFQARQVRIAREREFEHLFDDCDRGAIPPFGNLYGVPVVVSENLNPASNIVFNAGTHTELWDISFEAFEKVMGPQNKYGEPSPNFPTS